MNVWKLVSVNIFVLIAIFSGLVIKPVLPTDYLYYEAHEVYWRYVEYDFMRALMVAALFLVIYVIVEVISNIADKKRERGCEHHEI